MVATSLRMPSLVSGRLRHNHQRGRQDRAGAPSFKAAPIVGKTLAELVATGSTPDLIEPFRLERFYEDRLLSQLAAAAVSH
jgi:hypothetical protein